MAPLMRLPGYQVPENALLNLAGVNQAMVGIRQSDEQDRQFGLQQDQMGMQREQLGMERQKFQADQQRQQVERIAAIAEAADRETDPVRRKAIYDRALSQHPDYASGKLDPVYMDPVNGPKLLMAEAGRYRDTIAEQERQTGLDLKRAQLGQMKLQSPEERARIAQQYGLQPGTQEYKAFVLSGTYSGGEKLGTVPIMGVGPDGRPAVMQLGQGALVAAKPPEGYSVDPRGTLKVDTGTGTQLITPGGRVVADVGKDVAGAAAQKEIGEAQGKSVSDLPRITDNANRTLQTIDQIRNHPGKRWGVGAVGVLPGVPGTEQRGFVNLVEQAKGQTFLEAFNSLRGGGAITEAEGAKATQALARLDRAQRPEDFDQALKDLEDVVRSGLARAQRSVGGGQTAPRSGGMAPGAYTFDPATGQLVPQRQSDATRRNNTLDQITR